MKATSKQLQFMTIKGIPFPKGVSKVMAYQLIKLYCKAMRSDK
jgi:hypothetical protein